LSGYGAAWNDFERVDNTRTVVTGGTGFRYEIARAYGLHMGVDLAFGPDVTAISGLEQSNYLKYWYNEIN